MAFPFIMMCGRIWVSLAATVMIVFPLTFLFGMIFPTASVCYARDISRNRGLGGLAV